MPSQIPNTMEYAIREVKVVANGAKKLSKANITTATWKKRKYEIHPVLHTIPESILATIEEGPIAKITQEDK